MQALPSGKKGLLPLYYYYTEIIGFMRDAPKVHSLLR